MDELLSLYQGVEGDGVDGDEGATESGSDIASHPILAACISELYISCFSVTPSRDRIGSLL
jgi:hypothetical protein